MSNFVKVLDLENEEKDLNHLSGSFPIIISKNNVSSKKQYDPNFSIYYENKPKNTPPREDLLKQHINLIYPKATSEWVDSELVIKYQACSIQFTR